MLLPGFMRCFCGHVRIYAYKRYSLLDLGTAVELGYETPWLSFSAFVFTGLALNNQELDPRNERGVLFWFLLHPKKGTIFPKESARILQGSLKDTFCPFETWLFPQKSKETAIYKAMFRGIM